MVRRIFSILLFSVFVLGISSDANAQKKAPKRSFVKVTGDIYRYQNNFHFGMAVETKDGVVVTDPINSDMVKWLRAEIKKRFNKPVTTRFIPTAMVTTTPAVKNGAKALR